MDSAAGLWPQIILIILLTYINGFFASAEIAIVSANRERMNDLAEDGDKRAATLLHLTTDQTRFLSTIQAGITLASFFSAGLIAKDISRAVGLKLEQTGFSYGYTVSFILMTIVFSFITLVFGELVPKRLALQNTEKTALKSAGVISAFYKVMRPFVFLTGATTSGVLKAMGKYSENVEKNISEEEIKSYLRVGHQHGVINESGEVMMVNIMDFDDKLAYEIMTPRTSLYMLDYDDFDTDKIRDMLESGYSRVPVYRDGPDNIVGTIYIKDLFVEYAKQDYRTIDINKVMKKPYFVPETKNIDRLLQELQATKNYLAILIDEYGGLAGMVTIEDIVEEIVGEIEDEYDDDVPPILKVNASTYVADGMTELDTINEKLNLDLESENHETISGLTIELLGFIPEPEDTKKHSVLYENRIKLTTLAVSDKRISRVEIKLLEDSTRESVREASS
ncbi:MAG: hemolysin family protein [Peptoniphilus sp.]|nr:hemolysin family protein [Peptoniphilus sp.]MDD7363286.1 hemolysin family protein [Bacillota bacterium]MDY6045379.1 hemolysin family protein [Peptoniphilus sp.]